MLYFYSNLVGTPKARLTAKGVNRAVLQTLRRYPCCGLVGPIKAARKAGERLQKRGGPRSSGPPAGLDFGGGLGPPDLLETPYSGSERVFFPRSPILRTLSARFFAAPPQAATQLRQDVLREALPDLAMARDGLVNSRLGIAVPVMPRSEALPSMSCSPHPFGSFRPTGCGPELWLPVVPIALRIVQARTT